jgi:hypothetical protein
MFTIETVWAMVGIPIPLNVLSAVFAVKIFNGSDEYHTSFDS